MSISAISSNETYAPISQDPIAQRQSEFKQLGQDLQAGNVSQAKQDLAALVQTQPAGSPVPRPLTALNQALNSGDLASAQEIFAKIQQSLEAHRQQVHSNGTSESASDSSTQSSDGSLNVSA